MPMLRSCGEAASRQASRSASGISVARLELGERRPGADAACPRSRAARRPEMSTSVSASSSPSRELRHDLGAAVRGARPRPARPRRAARAARAGARSRRHPAAGCPSRRALPPRLGERAQHLLARDRQRADVGAGRVADRVRDRGGDRDDRRLAEPLRAEVRQLRVGHVDELADDLRHVGDRRQPVGVERPSSARRRSRGRSAAARRGCGRSPG